MMGILKRLFGGRGERPYVDKTGLYFYVQCDHCGNQVKLRADKQHDLNQREDGFVWHKTVVDPRCFKHIPVIVTMDRNYQVINMEIEGGSFISEGEYEPPQAAGTPS